jgi:hypothetical protein
MMTMMLRPQSLLGGNGVVLVFAFLGDANLEKKKKARERERERERERGQT